MRIKLRRQSADSLYMGDHLVESEASHADSISEAPQPLIRAQSTLRSCRADYARSLRFPSDESTSFRSQSNFRARVSRWIARFLDAADDGIEPMDRSL